MVSLARPTSNEQAAPEPPPTPTRGPLDDLLHQLLYQAGRASGVVVGLTSAVEGEGTSTIARALAGGLSRQTRGERPVMLLNCDPDAEAPPEAGTSRVVARTRSGARLQERTLQALQIDGVRPGADGLPAALEALRGRHSFVVLDLPPLLGSPLAAEIAGAVDRLFLVVRAGATREGMIREALERVGRDRVEAVILNDVRPQPSGRLSRWVS